MDEGSSMRLCRLAPTDARRAQALLHEAHAWNLAHGFNFWAATAGLRDVEGTLAGHLAFGLVEGRRLVGMAVLREDQGHAHLANLAVSPAAQGRGVGRRLIAAIEEAARERGYGEVVLDTPASHPWLPGFYARLGYVTFDEVQWPERHYRSVLMRKRFGSGEGSLGDGSAGRPL